MPFYTRYVNQRLIEENSLMRNLIIGWHVSMPLRKKRKSAYTDIKALKVLVKKFYAMQKNRDFAGDIISTVN